MPTLRGRKNKKWAALVKHRRFGKQVYLGVFDTFQEAKAVEDAFKKKYPIPLNYSHWLQPRDEKGRFAKT